VESLNGKLCDELLNGEIFYTVVEARVLIERWRERYNRVRQHNCSDTAHRHRRRSLFDGYSSTCERNRGGCRSLDGDD
jgi:hypothetical protein